MSMKRLDWRLIRPFRAGACREPSVADEVERLVEQAVTQGLVGEEMAELVALEERYQALTVPPCEAVSAPRLEDDPDWESRLIDEYGESDLDLELEDYLSARRREHDCERCPYASPYSLFPMDPCEFSAGALEVVLDDEDLWLRAQQAMTPPAMVALATDLAAALAQGRYRGLDELDARDYLEKAIFFLRFWADLGFAVRPARLDQPDEDAARDLRAADDPGETPPVLH